MSIRQVRNKLKQQGYGLIKGPKGGYMLVYLLLNSFVAGRFYELTIDDLIAFING